MFIIFFFDENLTSQNTVCIFSLAMKNKTLKDEPLPSGVTVLSGKKLAPYLATWRANGGTPHSLYVAMRGVPGGRGIDGQVIERIALTGFPLSITDPSKYGLVMALRRIHPEIVWDDISEDFEA